MKRSENITLFVNLHRKHIAPTESGVIQEENYTVVSTTLSKQKGKEKTKKTIISKH